MAGGDAGLARPVLGYLRWKSEGFVKDQSDDGYFNENERYQDMTVMARSAIRIHDSHDVFRRKPNIVLNGDERNSISTYA